MKTLAAIATLLLLASTASAQSWDDVPRDKKGRPWPERMPYREGAPVPNGYHVDTGVRSGLIIGGSITFGLSYALCVYAASRSSREADQVLYAPIVGPFIYAASLKNDTYGFGTLFGVFLGAIQTGGAAMLLVGFIPKTQLVRNDVGWRVLPVVAPNHQGLAVVGTF